MEHDFRAEREAVTFQELGISGVSVFPEKDEIPGSYIAFL